jgi:hypothetical protein
MPPKMREPIFQELLETCEKGKFVEKEWTQYEDSVMAYADLKNYTDYAHEQGHEKGFAQGVERVVGWWHSVKNALTAKTVCGFYKSLTCIF